MKLPSAVGTCLLFSLLFAAPAPAQILSPLPPDVWPTAIDGPLTPSVIWQLIRDRNYAALWRLAKDEAIKAARDQIMTNANLGKYGGQLAMRLNAIFDHPTKSQTQKYDELLQLTDNSLEPTKSAPFGALRVTLQHSIELGITRLEWDDKVRNGSQSGGGLGVTCVGSTGQMNCTPNGSYSTCYYRSQPDYFIYRIVNGQSTFITKISGSLAASGSSSITVTDSLWKSAWSAAQYYYTTVLSGNYPAAVPGRAFFYDFQADLRPPGSTLSYRVDTFDDWLLPPSFCGAATGKVFTTTVVADANGDARMDYLSAADYSKYVRKYFGWFSGVLETVVQ